MSEPGIIRLEHFYPHPPAAVWRALIDPELSAKWLVPGDVRPVVGHRFTLDMGRFGNQACVVIAVEAERFFSYRFAEGSLDTTLSFRLTPEGEGTRLELTHEGFDLDSPMGRQAFEGMRSGWPGIMGRLAAALSA